MIFEVSPRDCYPCGEIDDTGCCAICGRQLFSCDACGSVTFSEDDANDHDEVCDVRTVLDDIVEALAE